VAIAVPSSRLREGAPERFGGADRAGNRSGVAEIQRARMIAAMARLSREQGVACVTVAQVVACSGVSRRTFYELFSDRDDCFRAAFEQGVQRAARRVVPAYRAARGWREQMRAGLGALLEFLEEEPDLGALCVVVALGASPIVLERRAEIADALVEAVDAGRREARENAKPTRLTAEGVVGAVLAVLHSRLAAGEPTLDLQGALLGMIVLPYRGLAAAGRETPAIQPDSATQPGSRSTALRRPSPSPPRSDPLRDLDMRLTYRTVRVLLAIASDPGASNRRVADAAGITDPGQISKLLTRLEHVGLIENEIEGPMRGEPNAWRLTTRGQAVEQAISQP
jgi:AcrR family transcriptional regulator